MVSESKLGCCRICGNPYHRSWQCRLNPKNIAKMNQSISPSSKSSPVSCKRSTGRSTVKPSTSRAKLIKRYDELFSKYLRLKAQKENRLFCYTCGKKLTYDTAVVMHFIGRRYISVRFDEDNVHIGCRKCNCPDKDQPVVLHKYAELLGAETVSYLNAKKNQRISTPELEESYKSLRENYNNLLSS